jgi:hypothetical protein
VVAALLAGRAPSIPIASFDSRRFGAFF